MTFEELQALFDSREIDITALEEGMLDEASYFGRIFLPAAAVWRKRWPKGSRSMATPISS